MRLCLKVLAKCSSSSRSAVSSAAGSSARGLCACACSGVCASACACGGERARPEPGVSGVRNAPAPGGVRRGDGDLPSGSTVFVK